MRDAGFLPQTWAEVRADGPLYLAVLAYVVGALLLGALLGDTRQMAAFGYLPVWAILLSHLGLAYVGLIELPAAIKASPNRPFSALVGRLKRRVTPRLAAGILLLAALAAFYGAFTYVKNLLPTLGGFRFDAWAAGADAALHWGQDPWRLLQSVLGRPAATRAIEFLYAPVWTALLLAVPACIATSRRLSALKAQFFVVFMLCWVGLGNILAGLVMTAGPAFYAQVTHDSHRYAALLDYHRANDGLIHSAIANQSALWSLFESGQAVVGSGISAFPSLHVSMATLFVLVGWRIDRRLGAGLLAFAVLILAGSIHLGWHYAIDGYASIAATVALWFAVGRLLKLRSRGPDGLATV